MNRRRVFPLLAVAVVLIAGGAAQGQGCAPGGQYGVCGPCPPTFDILYDGEFDQTSCGAWTFTTNTERASDGSPCGWDNYYAKVSGPTSGYMIIHQETVSRTDYGNRFSFAYSLNLDDPNGEVQVWIRRQPDGAWVLAHMQTGSTGGCRTYTSNLGEQTTWDDGETLLVVISAYVPTSGKTAKIDGVQLAQY